MSQDEADMATVEGAAVAKDDTRPDVFEVRVTGAGVELTRPVNQATALSVISIILGGSAVVPTAPTPSGAGSYVPPVPTTTTPVEAQRNTPHPSVPADDSIDTRMTVGEFIDDCGAKRNPEKITAIGYYLEVRLGQGSFTKEEVKSQFRPAGEPVPGNYSRDFSDAITQRWIAEDADTRGRFYVANTGKSAIASKFSEQFGKPIRRANSRRKKATKPDNGASSAPETGDYQDLDNDE